MKNRFILVAAAILLLCHPAWTQEVSIEDCYRFAQANYPLIKQYDLIAKTKEYNLQNAGKGYLPQLAFSAKASWQSDVTEIPIDPAQLGLEGVSFPKLSQDQYGLMLDVNQTLWDGGEIKSQREGIRAAADVEEKNLEVSLYSINGRVNQLFFGILLADARLYQNQLLKEDLQRTCQEVASYVRNGIANQADLDAVKVNLLKAEQNEAEYRATKNAYTAMLAQLTGQKWNEQTRFVKPEWDKTVQKDIRRPELELYEAQIYDLQIENHRITAGLMPKLGLYATGGYGKPGLDMFENDFTLYLTAGVRLTWNIGNFYTLRNRRKTLQNNIRRVETQRETFLFDTSLDVVLKDETVRKYAEQLKYDDEIIRLKQSIRQASEKKMAGGTLSGTDLMRDINAEQQARQDKILHEMQLLLAIYDLKYITNHE